MKKQLSHGEVNGFSGAVIPDGAKKVTPKRGDFKLADSETTGNHHMVKVIDGVEIYEKDGIIYVQNDVPTDVYCVHENRHDRITIEPGIWEFESAKEFDYLTGMKRAVAD